MAEQPSKKQCFIVSPIGADDSDIRRAADFFREDIVRKALGEEFEIRRADDYNRAGNITSQVIQAIAKADLIVADLTGRNPNVYYELGFAHTHGRHVVPMINVEDENPLPFDNYTERTIKYSLRNVQDRDVSVARLKQAVQETLKEPVSNPVTTALGLAKAVAEGDDKAQLLDTLTRFVANLDRRVEQQDRQIQALNGVIASREPVSGGNALLRAIGNQLSLSGNALVNPPVDFLPRQPEPQGLGSLINPIGPPGLINSPLDPPGMRVPPDPRPPRGDKK